MSMQAILSASQSLMRMQTMQASNKSTQGQINVLKAEIKTDGGDSVSKQKEVEEMEERLAKNAGDLMSELTDINEELKPSENNKTQEQETEKEPKLDKVELSSQSKAGKETETISEQAKSGEPVIYRPKGDKIVVTPQEEE